MFALWPEVVRAAWPYVALAGTKASAHNANFCQPGIVLFFPGRAGAWPRHARLRTLSSLYLQSLWSIRPGLTTTGRAIVDSTRYVRFPEWFQRRGVSDSTGGSDGSDCGGDRAECEWSFESRSGGRGFGHERASFPAASRSAHGAAGRVDERDPVDATFTSRQRAGRMLSGRTGQSVCSASGLNSFRTSKSGPSSSRQRARRVSAALLKRSHSAWRQGPGSGG